MRSVVLLSGGLDSAVALKRALDDTEVALCLTFDYGQRAAQRELAAARAMCARFGAPHRAIVLDWLRELTRTALVDAGQELPELAPDRLDDRAATDASAAAVWVPNRNGVFIAVAAALAESLDAGVIVTGFNAEEAATFADNSADFVAATNAALARSTANRARVVSYTQHLTKAEIVVLGREIGAPIDLAWPCYREGPDLCGRCESCRRFERALRASGNWDWYRSASLTTEGRSHDR
jgi:7-cyano-7-deazaguanine synthase